MLACWTPWWQGLGPWLLWLEHCAPRLIGVCCKPIAADWHRRLPEGRAPPAPADADVARAAAPASRFRARAVRGRLHSAGPRECYGVLSILLIMMQAAMFLYRLAAASICRCSSMAWHATGSIPPHCAAEELARLLCRSCLGVSPSRGPASAQWPATMCCCSGPLPSSASSCRRGRSRPSPQGHPSQRQQRQQVPSRVLTSPVPSEEAWALPNDVD